eukprot:TRINITY_DN2794_c0_g1_i1.p1 TRINITY_DN2794_c0_g1~~TRINITY_DN2794_c0_g1_i1.p1  ORF type:complete len:612 (-),score=127.15 TRINITY_DN2794_c0_g1_i1:1041-2660(-)
MRRLNSVWRDWIKRNINLLCPKIDLRRSKQSSNDVLNGLFETFGKDFTPTSIKVSEWTPSLSKLSQNKLEEAHVTVIGLSELRFAKALKRLHIFPQLQISGDWKRRRNCGSIVISNDMPFWSNLEVLDAEEIYRHDKLEKLKFLGCHWQWKHSDDWLQNYPNLEYLFIKNSNIVYEPILRDLSKLKMLILDDEYGKIDREAVYPFEIRRVSELDVRFLQQIGFPLRYALRPKMRVRDYEAVEMILEKDRMKIQVEDGIIATESGREYVELLEKHGMKISPKFVKYIKRDDQAETLAYLLQNGVSVYTMNNKSTLLDVFIKKKLFECARVLLQNGYDVNLNKGRALREAFQSIYLPTIQLLIENGASLYVSETPNVHRVCKYSETPLTVALNHFDQTVIDYLNEIKVDWLAVNQEGLSNLGMMAFSDNRQAMEFLMKNGAATEDFYAFYEKLREEPSERMKEEMKKNEEVWSKSYNHLKPEEKRLLSLTPACSMVFAMCKSMKERRELGGPMTVFEDGDTFLHKAVMEANTSVLVMLSLL